MFGLGAPELIIILGIILIIFGPGRVPEMGRAIGSGIRELKNASKEVEEVSVIDEDKDE
ncbi:twin-arginine translocase TatA/TatE family subunit [Halarsenatibacter silvermanii]|uniref:Sec-independent protein translocase protein TatA n=1 Tax=Halarsenatibacter silvermanii TaxID=321763 RepID=A0A1G9SUR2_9FIRM|nr:twin-arginine translocase TatA/TatE family subunit [Halarsenatibacter silvermanii]SDM39163.1 sec-independent protein translocase protein TatA [Halarsenatibacter silvermanii]